MSDKAADDELEDGEDPNGPYRCPADECTKTFITPGKRYKHIKDKHADELTKERTSAW